jgi:hypothetical protein
VQFIGAAMIIDHRKRSPALDLWAVDTAPYYNLPMSPDVARLFAGVMGFPSKMPGTSYGLPAEQCITGRILAAIEGTVCSDCYALKGNYVYPDVRRAQAIRLAGTRHPRWPEAMAYLLNAMHGIVLKPKGLRHKPVKSKGWHRWHDAGDIQSVNHLRAIVRVCELTPRIWHWLPTREVKILAQWRDQGGILPDNLLIRVSATKIDGNATQAWPWTSGVFDGRTATAKERCTAPDTDGECGPCRKCWSRDQAHTIYHLH